VAVTDDDCAHGATWIEAIVRLLGEPGNLAAVTGPILPLGPATPGTYAVSSRLSTRRATFTGRTLPWLAGSGGNFAVHREWLERVGPYDERLGVGTRARAGEDMDMLYRLMRAGGRVQYEPDAVVFHARQSGERRLASRWGYGVGMGAFCGIWLRRGDAYAARIAAVWILDQGLSLGSALRRRQWPAVRERLLTLGGTAAGLGQGFVAPRLPDRGGSVRAQADGSRAA
jgi:hypothetical protein